MMKFIDSMMLTNLYIMQDLFHFCAIELLSDIKIWILLTSSSETLVKELKKWKIYIKYKYFTLLKFENTLVSYLFS